MAHRHELGEQVVRDRDDEKKIRQKREAIRAKAVVDPIARRDESMAPGDALQLGRVEEVADDDGHHEAHAHDPCITQARRLGRVAHDGVAAILRRVERQDEHERS